MNRCVSQLYRSIGALLCFSILLNSFVPTALLVESASASIVPQAKAQVSTDAQSVHAPVASRPDHQNANRPMLADNIPSPAQALAPVSWQQTNPTGPFQPLNLAATTAIQITDAGFSPATLSVFGPTDVTWINSTAVTQTLRSGTPPNTIYLPLVFSRTASENQTAATAAGAQATDAIIAILGPGASVTKRYEQPGQYFFYLQDAPQFTGSVSLAGVGLLHSSPVNGESDVAVTRETILEFSGPLDANSVTSEAIFASFSSNVLATHLHLSPDKRKVTIFYNQTLPASARVQVRIDGSKLKDSTGGLVDVNGDGVAGGQATLAFDTLTLTVLPGTVVCGRVFASELKALTYGVAGSSVSVNNPLQGVTISVDGMEQTLRTTTDGNGNFCLNPAPAGRFFVHVDGRTASNGVPTGSYYPFVGKAWDSVPGQQSNIGDVFLPLVPAGTLQPVSTSQDTVIQVAPSVLAELPNFADVKITVPSDSLYSDNGARGGKVGIAPVPPDRLPGKLPPGLEFPVVITVQTDGATNFDKPVPACFPNLPDSTTGQPLPAGAKNYLYSFNHDTGRFEPIGPMTVSADGKTICTDPGVGIVAPGWHGSGPAPVEPPPVRPPCKKDQGEEPNTEFEDCLDDCLIDALLSWGKDGAILGVCLVAAGRAGGPAAIAFARKACFGYLGISFGYNAIVEQRCISKCEKTYPACAIKPVTNRTNDVQKLLPFQKMSGTVDPIVEQITAINRQMIKIYYPYGIQGQLPPADVQAQIEALRNQMDALANGNAEQYIQNYSAQQDVPALNSVDPGNPPPYPVRYAATVERPTGDIYLRGQTEPEGQYNLFVPRDGKLQFVSFYDPSTNSFGIVTPYTRPNAPSMLPGFHLIPADTFTDFDQDKLVDVAEFIYGTDPAKADSDKDGVSDGAEVQNGSDPLDGLPARTGILATADTPGNAVDVCAINESTIAVADSAAGVAIFNVFNGMNPTLIAQVDTPGTAQAVACTDSRVLVADSSGGLSAINVSNPANAFVERRVALGNAGAVAVLGDTAYVGDGNDLVQIDLSTGNVVNRLSLNSPVQDLSLNGDYLYALTVGRLYTLRLDREPLQVVHSSDSPGDIGIHRLRLFAGGALLYTTRLAGYNTFSLANPAQPRLLTTDQTQQRGWKQIVANGSGLGVAAVGLNDNNAEPQDVWLFDIHDPNQAGSFLTEFTTPGLALGLTLNHSLAYVADGESGLQVINYQAYDNHGVAPTISLSTNFAPGVVEANAQLRITAQTSDDVQVRNVEFYMDGVRRTLDGSFPFETWLTTPNLATQSALVIRAKTTDTGGNVTWTEPMTLTLVADARRPYVVSVTPADGSSNAPSTVTSVTAQFNEALNSATVNGNTFHLFEAGADQMLGTPDDQAVSGAVTYDAGNNQAVLTPATALGPGNYRAVLENGITDAVGNGIENGGTAWRFTVGLVTWDGGGDGVSWQDARNWAGDQLPGNGALVLIDHNVSGAVLYNQGDLTLTSLQSNQPLRLEGGKLTLNAASTISNDLIISSDGVHVGGELSGSGTVTVTGTLTWTTGIMSGSGKTVATNRLDMTGQVLTLNGRTLDNAGIANWSYANNTRSINLQNGAIFNNLAGATFNDLSGNGASHAIQGVNNVRFNNFGAYVKTGMDTSIIVVNFTNTGSLNVQQGVFVMQNSADTSSGGFTVAAGSKLQFASDHMLAASAAFSGAGELVFTNGGIVTFNGFSGSVGLVNIVTGKAIFNTTHNVTVTDLLLEGAGELSGNDTVTVNGALTWTGGTMSGSGKTVVNTQLNITGQIVTLDRRTLDNAGVATWSNVGSNQSINLQNGAIFNNLAGATFNDQTNSSNTTIQGSSAAFNNLGAYVKTGTQASILDVNFSNSGSLNLQAGLLGLNKNGTNSGTMNLATATTLDINDAFVNQASGHISGTGTLDHTNATSFTNNGAIDPTVVVVP